MTSPPISTRAYSYVRMSTLEQRKGDSFRRQKIASARYALKCGLEIVESEEAYEDIRVSAFKGKNVKEGALGRFLEAVREGKIKRGSYLLVESLDRVSRETPYDACKTMRDIVEEGITVVDLSDNERLYSIAIFHSDTQAYMRMIVRFERAHEESKTKSDRVKEAWSAKRERAKQGGAKITSWCPAWLRLSKDNTRFEIIEKNAETVRWIFNEAADGRGIFAISRRLNKSSLAPFGKSRGWHSSYIIKILRNRAAIGEYRPTKVDGKTVTEVEVSQYTIGNYYPPIVSDDLFYRVQRGLSDRRQTGRGRKGQNFTNLFTGLKMSCAHCGGRVRFENKGSGPKGGLYLVCDNARRGHNCTARRWNYLHFEDSFVSFVHHELDVRRLGGDTNDSHRGILGKTIEAMRDKLRDLNEQRRKRIDLIDSVGGEVVIPLVNEITSEIGLVEGRLLEISQELDDLNAMAAADETGPLHFKQLVEILGAHQTDAYAVRSKLSTLIHGLVGEIVVAADQDSSDLEQQNDESKILDPHWAKDEEKLNAVILLTRLFGQTGARAYYVVRFKNSDFQIDLPPANPLDFPLAQEQSTASVFIFDNGSLQIVEAHALDAWVEEDRDDPDAPKIVAAGYVTTNFRTGSFSLRR